MTREQDLKARELERKVQMDEFAALQKKVRLSSSSNHKRNSWFEAGSKRKVGQSDTRSVS